MSVGRSLKKHFSQFFFIILLHKQKFFLFPKRSFHFLLCFPSLKRKFLLLQHDDTYIYTHNEVSLLTFLFGFKIANSYTKLYPFVFCILKQASVLCRCGLTCKPLRSGPGLILWWFVIPETSPCHPTTGPTHADLFSPPSQMVRLLTIVSRWSWWSGWLRWCESDSWGFLPA